MGTFPSDLTISFILSRDETIACYRRLAVRKWSLWAFVAFGIAFAAFGWYVAAGEFVVGGLVFSALYALMSLAIQPAAMNTTGAPKRT